MKTKFLRKTLIAVLTAMMSLVVIPQVNAQTQADVPLKQYVREGTSYWLSAQKMEYSRPTYYQRFHATAEELFEMEPPPLYCYSIDSRLKGLYGFQYDFDDGSRAIYLKSSIIANDKAYMVFIHEMVHDVYDTGEAIFYLKNENGYYRYKETMELITDIIATEKYQTLRKSSPYIETEFYHKWKAILNNPVLIGLYKGEQCWSNEEELLVLLDSLENAVVRNDEVMAKKIISIIAVTAGEDSPVFYYGYCRERRINQKVKRQNLI